jgi:hypothetical protein
MKRMLQYYNVAKSINSTDGPSPQSWFADFIAETIITLSHLRHLLRTPWRYSWCVYSTEPTTLNLLVVQSSLYGKCRVNLSVFGNLVNRRWSATTSSLLVLSLSESREWRLNDTA